MNRKETAMTPTTTIETITRQQIKDLRDEARADGDEALARTCTMALADFDETAARRCVEAIREAEAAS